MSIFGPPCVEGSGQRTTETRIVDAFNAIVVETAVDVTVSIKELQSVQLTGDDNVLPLITTQVSDETLTIAETECFTASQGIQAAIAIPEVTSLKTTSSGNISGPGLTLQNPKIQSTASGNVTLAQVTAESIDIEASASGSMTVSGTATSVTATTTGSGTINAENCTASECVAKTTGSGNIRVHATDSLKATISGSGNIYYSGNPTIEENISGSGKLIHVE